MALSYTQQLAAVNASLGKIMTTQAQLAADLAAATEQIIKSRNEIIAVITNLTAALNAANATTPEVNAAMAALRAQLQISDDLVPDPLP